MRIAGAVSSVPGRARELAERIATVSSEATVSSITTHYDTDGISLRFIARPDESPSDLWVLGSERGDDRGWFCGDSLTRQDRPLLSSDVGDAAERLAQTLEGGFVGVRVTPDGAVMLYTDSWGIGWVFVRELSDATAFASDFAALCSIEAGSLEVDSDNLLLEWGLGYVPDDGTIYRDISMLPPGSTTRLDAQRVSTISSLPMHYGDEWTRATRTQKLRRLDELFETMRDRMIANADGSVAISLSAGLDSRYALASLRGKNAVGPLFTFGDPASDEVIEARAVAHKQGKAVRWEHFDFEATSFQSWRSMIQSLGGAGIVQWCGWADQWFSFLRNRTPSCLIGFMGDAFSGKRMDLLPGQDALAARIDSSIDLWARRWVAWELDNSNWIHSPLLREPARARLIESAGAKFGKMLSTARIAQPHQSAQHCNFLGRQRRWIAAQPVLLASHVKPLLFFVDREFRKFWMNVALDDLRGQELYKRYAEDRFPALFPREPSSPVRFARRVAVKLRSLASASPPRRYRPPIPHTKLLSSHFPAIRSLLQRAAPVLDPFADMRRLGHEIDAFERGVAAPHFTSTMLIRTVNAMHLLDLKYGGPVS